MYIFGYPVLCLPTAPPPAAPDSCATASSYGLGDVLDSDPANVVGVIVKKVVSNHKPLDPVDDIVDLEDPEKPTG